MVLVMLSKHETLYGIFDIAKAIDKCFDFRPAAIIKNFDLRRPIYCQTAAYGHVGRNDIDLPWERTDLAERIKAAL